MITKITHITLFVHDQDEALKFYKKLGFNVHTDAMFNENMRWLTLNLPEQKDVELALMPAYTPEEKALVGKQGGAKPFLSIQSNDCLKDYESLKKAGVEFLDKPATQPWGISVSFKDLYGNIIYLNQPS